MEKTVERIFTELKNDASTYCELKLELLKLYTYERVAKIIATLSYGVLLLLLAFFIFLFLFLALGFYLGTLLENTALGFMLVAGLYGLFFLLLTTYRRKIQVKVMNVIIDSMMDKDEKEDESTTNFTRPVTE